MCKVLKRSSFIFFLILFIGGSNSLIYSQQTEVIRQDTSELVGFDVLAPLIEKNNQVKIYFKSEWFAGKRFRASIAKLPLNNCLTIVKRITELNCIAINNSSYVFVPVEIRNYTNRVNSKGVVLIGDVYNSESNVKANVSGKIIDAETGKPLYGARIIIDKLNKSISTDRAGNYSMTIPSGEYELRLNYADFEENVKTIRVGGDGIVDFELAKKTILLKEVLITDKAADLNVIRTQMSLIRLNAKMIKELPDFMGEKDVIKSITLLPGVQSTGEFGTGFFVRGGSADQNLIMIEDVPLFNSSHMFGLSSVVNPDGVNSVNFLKAGIPAKYGERASSVMDIRLGSNPEKISAKGGIGLLNTRLNLEIPLFDRRASLLLGGRSSYSNWLLHSMPDIELKNSSAGFYDMNILFTMRLNPKNSVVLFGYISDDTFSFSESSPYHYDNALFSVRYNHTFSEKLNSTLLLGYSRYRNDMSEVDSLKPKDAYIIKSSIDYNNAKLNFSWLPNDKHNVEFGLNSVLYRLQPGMMTPVGLLSEVESVSTGREKALETAIYISDNVSFSPNVSAEFGLRLNSYAYLGPTSVLNFDLNTPHTTNNITDTLNYAKNQVAKWYSSIEPRISFRYSVDKFSSLKFSYNRISQFINLISNTAVMAPTDVYKLSSPNVKPLVSNQFAIGYFRNLNNNSIEASVEIYYKKLNNIVEYRDGARILLNNSLETDLLNASGYNYGIEFYLKKNTGKLTGWASYTYSRSMRRTNSTYGIDQINDNNYFPSSFDKPHNIVIMGNYHATRRWRFSGTFTYNSGKPVTLPELKYEYGGKQYIYYSDRNKYRLPDYHRLDLAITLDESLRLKQKWKGSWTFSVLNVYGRKNPYSVFYKSASKLESAFNESFNLYNLFIIAKPIPTLTYNFTF